MAFMKMAPQTKNEFDHDNLVSLCMDDRRYRINPPVSSGNSVFEKDPGILKRRPADRATALKFITLVPTGPTLSICSSSNVCNLHGILI